MRAQSRPKAESINVANIKNGKNHDHMTLKNYITENDRKPYRVQLLRGHAKSTHDPKWLDYHEFFLQNWSGDIETFSPEDRKMIDQMIKDLDDRRKGKEV